MHARNETMANEQHPDPTEQPRRGPCFVPGLVPKVLYIFGSKRKAGGPLQQGWANEMEQAEVAKRELILVHLD